MVEVADAEIAYQRPANNSNQDTRRNAKHFFGRLCKYKRNSYNSEGIAQRATRNFCLLSWALRKAFPRSLVNSLRIPGEVPFVVAVVVSFSLKEFAVGFVLPARPLADEMAAATLVCGSGPPLAIASVSLKVYVLQRSERQPQYRDAANIVCVSIFSMVQCTFSSGFACSDIILVITSSPQPRQVSFSKKLNASTTNI